MLGLEIIALTLLGGCVGSGEGVPDVEVDGASIPTTTAEIQSMIFEPLCVSCHRGGAAPKGLSLEADRALKGMVGIPAVELPELLRVAPGQPEQSYLIVKVVAGDARRVGARMPRTGPPFVSASQVRALRQWITAGATEDWIGTSTVGPVVTVASGLEEGEESWTGE